MEVQLLYLLDYDLRIDESELIEHFSPFFKRTALVSFCSTPAAKQQVMKGMSYSASCDDVFTASSASRAHRKGDCVPAPVALSTSVPAAAGKIADGQPTTPDLQRQGTKRAIFTRSGGQAVRRPCPGSGASSASDDISCADLTEDHSSSDGFSSATSDDESILRSKEEDFAIHAKTGMVRIAGVAKPRFMATRSASATSIASRATSFPMTPSSSNDSVDGPTALSRHGIVKSVSYYQVKSPSAGRGKTSWL